jgi:hypothetical protein
VLRDESTPRLCGRPNGLFDGGPSYQGQPSSAAAAQAMVFKLVESAQARWRAVNAPHLVALVRAGARFERGRLIERQAANPGSESAA